MGFEDQVVIVTGAGKGIGKAVACGFAREKAHVVINDMSPSLIERTLADECFRERRCLGIQADVGSSSQVQKMVDEVLATFGRVDVLVNNAGIIRRGNVETVTEEEWDDVIRVNLKGTFNCSKAVTPIMKRQGRGKIINVSSVAGKIGDITSAPGYGPSKAGMDALTKTFARQLAVYDINVNGVAPHAIETEMSAEWPEEKRKQIIEAIPLKRLGKPEDVAAAVLFLASENADFITGEIIDVNGGFVMD